MAFSPITAWQIERARVEAVTDFLFARSKITAEGDCSHEIKRHLLLGRKTMKFSLFKFRLYTRIVLYYITADDDCSHEFKRRLCLGRKVMTKLDSILKSRDITLPTKVRLVKAMVFPVVMYGCESWTVKKAEL